VEVGTKIFPDQIVACLYTIRPVNFPSEQWPLYWLFFFNHMGVSFYLTTRITIPSDPSAWRQEAKHSPLFQFTVSRGPRVLVQRVAVNIRCLFTIFTQKAI